MGFQTAEPVRGCNFIWDRPVPWCQPKYLHRNTHFGPLKLTSNIQQPRHFRQILLKKDGYILQVLTVFFNARGGTNGIGVHFRREESSTTLTSQWLGHQVGFPLHLQLKRDENISLIWAFHFKFRTKHPYIAVRGFRLYGC
jgi:hypothetical protein